MKPNPARPFVVVASLLAAAAVIGADTTPKKKNAKAEEPESPKAAPVAEAPAKPAAKIDPKADEVLATVNGDTIKRSDVDAAIGKILAQRGMPADALPPGQKDQIVRTMLDDMILDKLVSKASVEVKIPEAEVEGEFQKIRQRRGGTDEEIKKDLEKLGMTLETLKTEIRDRMQKMKWVSDQTKGKYQEATDAEAKEFYEKNPQHFEQPEQVRASHILIKLEKDANPTQVTEAMKKAEGAIVRAKKEDFAKLAEELSDDPGSKVKGGDLEFFPRQGAMVEPFAEAAFKLKKDEVTAEPVRSQFGYHVIKQTDRKPASKQAFEEAKTQIVGFLGNERKNAAVQGVLDELRGKAKVEVNLPPPVAPAAGAPAVATPPVAAPQPKRAPVEAVTPPVSAPPIEPKK